MGILLKEDEIKEAVRVIYPGIETIACDAAKALCQAQLLKVVGWSSETCHHHSNALNPRRYCTICWWGLRREAGNLDWDSTGRGKE